MRRKIAPLLTREEIVRWLRRFRHDEAYRDENGSYSVPFKSFCDYAGVARQNIYALLHDRIPLTSSYQQRLSEAIFDVQNGLRFRRRNKVYEIVGEFSKLPRREWPPVRDTTGDTGKSA